MRVAVLIIGLMFFLITGFQSCVGYLAGSGLEALGSSEGTILAEVGAVGLLVSFLFLIGSAFVIGIPGISIVAFILAGILGLAISSDFPDMAVWGALAFVLAVLSFFGRRELRAKQAEANRKSSASP